MLVNTSAYIFAVTFVKDSITRYNIMTHELFRSLLNKGPGKDLSFCFNSFVSQYL